MKKTILFFSVSVSALFLLVSCGEPNQVEKRTIITTITANAEDTLVDKPSRFQTQAHAGQFVYRADSINSYAATIKYDMNDSLVNSNLKVFVNYWARTSNPVAGQGLAVSFQDNDKAYIWATIEPVNYGAKANEWINIIDSVNVPAEAASKTGLFFKFFGYSNNKASMMDIDDISITVKKIELVSED